jgi:arabinose-5-phosphate isomerase
MMINDFLVNEVMIKTGEFPVVNQNELLRETLEEMNKFGLGIACIIDKNSKLIGVITDGDIRRLILRVQKPLSAIFVDDAISYSSKNFANVIEKSSIQNALTKMEELKIWDLPVLDEQGKLKGLLHLHPALKFVLRK